MSKVYQTKEYDPQFPEKFNWGILDSYKLSEVACELAQQVRNELAQPVGNRVNVSGLRFALQRIAGKADVQGFET